MICSLAVLFYKQISINWQSCDFLTWKKCKVRNDSKSKKVEFQKNISTWASPWDWSVEQYLQVIDYLLKKI